MTEYEKQTMEYIERQAAVVVWHERNVIAQLPDDIQLNIRRRAHHALPRSARLMLSKDDQALYESEVALELAQLYIDIKNGAL